MKKKFNMKKKISAVILCMILGMTSLVCMPVQAEESAEASSQVGRLTITEINAAQAGINPTNMFAYPFSNSYQYIEVLNTSEADVDLSDYYLFRYSYCNVDGAKVWSNLKSLLGDTSVARKLAKVRVTETETVLKPGEVALLWLNNTDKTVADFRSFWEEYALLASDVKIIDVNTYGYPAYNAQGENSTMKRTGEAFLPVHLMNCILELVNVNHTYSGVNAETDMAVDIEDTSLVKARHAAADSLALYITTHESTWDAKDSVMENGRVNSRHFYSYVDAEKYAADAAELSPSLTVDTDICQGTAPAVFAQDKMEAYLSNMVHGKLNADGKYAVGAGLEHYINNISADLTAPDQHGLFLDDGTDSAPTPGVINNGQFGAESSGEDPGGNAGDDPQQPGGEQSTDQPGGTQNKPAESGTQTDARTEAPTAGTDSEKKKGGCSSAIGGGILTAVLLSAGGVLLKKRKRG